MGVVYSAIDPDGHPCALKLLLDLSEQDSLDRFVREAHGAARLSHPNLVRVVDYGIADGHPYLVMPLLEGTNLKERLRAGPLPIKEVIEIGIALAGGLAHAHAVNVLHRDIKPENVVAGPKGPVLTDFGLAKPLLDRQSLTATGQVLGTPSYMAPEQAMGAKSKIGVGTDVYGLGALLYALLTGRPPFEGSSALMTLTAVIDGAPTPPSALRPEVPSSLEALVLRCLAKDPNERFADMADLRQALRQLGEPGATAAAPPTSRRAIALGVVLGIGLLVGLASWAGVQSRQPRAATSQASVATSPPSHHSPSKPRTTKPTPAKPTPRLAIRRPLRARLGLSAGENAFDKVYDQLVVGRESKRKVAQVWLDAGGGESTDPDLRLAWALVLQVALADASAAALICEELEPKGMTPRLRVMRAMTANHIKPPGRDLAWICDELRQASAHPDAPRYARGLYAWSLMANQDQNAAIHNANLGIERGDPGAAAILALVLGRQVTQDWSPVLGALEKLEELSNKLWGRVPAKWLVLSGQVLFQAGEPDQAERRFERAINERPWSGASQLAYAEQLRKLRKGGSAAPDSKKIKDLLASAGLRAEDPNEAKRILNLLGQYGREGFGRILRLLARRNLRPAERRGRADLFLQYLDFLTPADLSVASEDLRVSATLEGSPLRRQHDLLAQVRIRCAWEGRASRPGVCRELFKKAKALGPKEPQYLSELAWYYYWDGPKRFKEIPGLAGRAGILIQERASLPKAGDPTILRMTPARLLGLKAESLLLVGDLDGFHKDLKTLRALHKYSDTTLGIQAKLQSRFLDGMRLAKTGKFAEAKKRFELLTTRKPAWFRWRDARVYLAWCLARLNQPRRAREVLASLGKAELPATTRVLRAFTNLMTRNLSREERASAALRLKDTAKTWPEDSFIRHEANRIYAKIR